MNRKNLTAAVLAGLAGTAGIASTVQAVNLNPDGLGQVLIYPYYTTKGGNATLLSVVNTSEEAKAVKVRFLEGMNSQEVLDFNLYMSAFDVWVAAVIDGGVVDTNCDIDNGINANQCGVPHLEINDNSCTVPYLYDMASTGPGLQTFLTGGITDMGPETNARISEGHFEMIEMGTLVGQSAADADHGNTGVPADCDALVQAWTEKNNQDNGYWLDDPLIDIEAPSGGLFGGGAIINPDAGTMFAYNARAINGFADSVFGSDGPLHGEPGFVSPSLNSGNVTDAYVFTDDGGQASASFSEGVDAVSYVFMHDNIMNEYNAESETDALSEWVVTFPTKRFYVNGVAPMAPFTTLFEADSDGNWGACEPVLLSIWDRNEQIPGGNDPEECPPVVSPAPEVPCEVPENPFSLCFETNVIRFGDAGLDGVDIPSQTEILGSENFTNVATDAIGFSSGWAKIDMYEYRSGVQQDIVEFRDPLDGDGDDAYGLPATGFWVLGVENGFVMNAEGELAIGNYGGLFDQKATKCFDGIFCRDVQISPQ